MLNLKILSSIYYYVGTKAQVEEELRRASHYFNKKHRVRWRKVVFMRKTISQVMYQQNGRLKTFREFPTKPVDDLLPYFMRKTISQVMSNKMVGIMTLREIISEFCLIRSHIFLEHYWIHKPINFLFFFTSKRFPEAQIHVV